MRDARRGRHAFVGLALPATETGNHTLAGIGRAAELLVLLQLAAVHLSGQDALRCASAPL